MINKVDFKQASSCGNASRKRGFDVGTAAITRNAAALFKGKFLRTEDLGVNRGRSLASRRDADAKNPHFRGFSLDPYVQMSIYLC